MKIMTEELTIALKYVVGKEDPDRGYYPGGVQDPLALEELQVWVERSQRFSYQSKSFSECEGYQIHIGGSRRSLFELGRYLIALSRYHTSDRSYHDHLDEIGEVAGKERCEIIIHGPKN